ncbi:site-specific integrase [Lysinibacillus fusiformis]
MTNKKSSPIKSYKKKDGKTYYQFQAYLGINELTGKLKTTTKRGFKTKSEAELALARIKVQVSDGAYRQSTPETYQQIYELWITQYERTVEESTFVKTVGYFKNHILPAMGEYKIEKITLAICQKHFDEWAMKLSKASTIKVYAAKVLDFAIKHDLIQTNPFTHVETKTKSKYSMDEDEKTENYYIREELLNFLSQCEKSVPYKAYALLRLLAFTGMRKSEVLALTWQDLNLVENELIINKAVGRGKHSKLYLKPTKTGHPRIIKLDDETIDVLSEWRKRQTLEYFKLGINTMNPKQLIFSNSKNEFIQLGQIQKWMYSVQNKHSLKRVTPHGLRHTHCSLLFEAGATIKEVQDRLGHTDVKTTMDIYTHVTKKAKEGAIQKFVTYLES